MVQQIDKDLNSFFVVLILVLILSQFHFGLPQEIMACLLQEEPVLGLVVEVVFG